MRNALLKDTLREIKRTLSRFISIFAIVALGVAFFAGIKATGPDMKLTADKYFDDYRLMDIRLLSTIGFNDDDLDAVKRVPGVLDVMPTYSIDALVSIKDKDLVLKVLALPLDKIKKNDESYINRVKLVRGRYPQRPGECVTEKGKILNSGMTIGSKIKLTSGPGKDIGNSIKADEFTIVGIVETPYYISFERGTSSIGSGKVNNFIMIPQEDFKIPVYTDIFLTVKGALETASYDDKYDDIIEPVKKALENEGKERADIRYNEILSNAKEQLQVKSNELEGAETSTIAALSSAEQKLEVSRKQIEDGERELATKEEQFNSSLIDAELKVSDSERKLEEGENEYNLKFKAFREAKIKADADISDGEIKIEKARKDISDSEALIAQFKEALSTGQYSSDIEKEAIEAQVTSGEQQLAIAKAQLSSSISELEDNKKILSETEKALSDSRIALDNMRQQLESEKERLQNSKSSTLIEFSNAEKKLDDSRMELDKGQYEYEKSKEESSQGINEAQAKIAEAEQEVNKIEKPEWYVLNRDTNPGFVEFGNAAERMDAIAQVFPVFFFLVSALVCLTTMTRMVDEQRVYIGSFKALGYGRFTIASKYLIYAILASLSGSIFGVLVGFQVFPTVIYNAYGIMYTMPPVITDFNISFALISAIAAVLGTTLAAWIACSKELAATPASLMLPKAPKAGKRIFLERIKFIWSRLNFTQKVTARNILRYKKRFFMTILGISGCTALLLSGFGLKDSIMSIVTKQFDELYKYDMVIGLKDSVGQGESIGLYSIILKDGRISSYLPAKEQVIDAGAGDVEKSVSLIVPDNAKKMENFIILRDRTTGKKVTLTDNGVVLSEKLASKLSVEIGDEIYIKDEDSKKIPVKVSGITENYVSHYIYMTPALYESVYGDKVKFTELLAKATDTAEDFENKLSTDLLKDSDVSSINFTTGISKNFNDIISSLNYIVLVLIVSAGALAFVVLYNLTNINVSERLREIASIKVLGFFDREVSAYVYRENVILTIIGMALGLIFGIFLHKYVVITAEVDYVMFGRDILPLSYVYAAILTVVFSGLVNLVMYFKLKKIKMVESLKSID